MIWKKYSVKHIVIIISAVTAVTLGTVFFPIVKKNGVSIAEIKSTAIEKKAPDKLLEPKITHIRTPKAVKAIYMTGWVAGTKTWREQLVGFIKKTEINSLVIDVKDYTGMVSFDTGSAKIKEAGSEEVRVKDMREFLAELHGAGIYAIARITVFQDPYYAKKHLSIAVQTKKGALWKDRKGISYIDPGAKEYWDYIVEIARASEKAGFDELNFDYIRFPSDGNMSDIVFPVSGALAKDKPAALDKFFSYLHKELREGPNALSTPISADVFGMVTSNTDDLNIGQLLEPIASHFDFVAPMVYPSHYPATFLGYKNPSAHPYEVVRFAMEKGVGRLQAPTSTPTKLRPWLQDFDLGADYGAAEVRAQMKAVYDAGLTSWMIWDASNKYTQSAFGAE
ncbi:MAG: putative glycoside hydrolase [bacterium]|nr:putative glycoside hydrolase [bacterium]